MSDTYNATGSALDSWEGMAGHGGANPHAKPFPPARLPYVKIAGITDLSHSKTTTLHACPRKFLLKEIEGLGSFTPTVHTAFGHAYGAGVQTFLQYAPMPPSVEQSEGIDPDWDSELYAEQHARATRLAMISVLAYWDMYDIDATDPTGIKSFSDAVRAVRIFIADSTELLRQYSMYTFTDVHGKQKAANELLVYVTIADSYAVQMHIDCVLQDRDTGELAVLEIKTGSKTFERSDYENSGQSMGYCVALQAAFGLNQVQHKSIYVCYNAKDRHTHIFEFERTLDIGMEWAASTLMDVAMLVMYKEQGFYPKRGTACKQWGRTCEFFGTCGLSQRAQPSVQSYNDVGIEVADIVISSEQILSLIG